CLRAWELSPHPRPTAGWAVHEQASSDRSRPVVKADEARATPSVGSTGAVVNDLDLELSVRLANPDRHRVRSGMLHGIRHGLGDDVVSGRFDRLGIPLVARAVDGCQK